ncbi:hypothetical protein FA95DRAFT_1019715 [Auriscalpium vulgare]|uniref:Uncharacterized protein n=1 Tax=Auriscalpium vulgare TaxID=40419 RepID=A0ACB8R5V4_9AGAM|nr:hypothetical protein FA95DRAFT_1019715 [Auriscalpium vulgare]
MTQARILRSLRCTETFIDGESSGSLQVQRVVLSHPTSCRKLSDLGSLPGSWISWQQRRKQLVRLNMRNNLTHPKLPPRPTMLQSPTRICRATCLAEGPGSLLIRRYVLNSLRRSLQMQDLRSLCPRLDKHSGVHRSEPTRRSRYVRTVSTSDPPAAHSGPGIAMPLRPSVAFVLVIDRRHLVPEQTGATQRWIPWMQEVGAGVWGMSLEMERITEAAASATRALAQRLYRRQLPDDKPDLHEKDAPYHFPRGAVPSDFRGFDTGRFAGNTYPGCGCRGTAGASACLIAVVQVCIRHARSCGSMSGVGEFSRNDCKRPDPRSTWHRSKGPRQTFRVSVPEHAAAESHCAGCDDGGSTLVARAPGGSHTVHAVFLVSSVLAERFF